MPEIWYRGLNTRCIGLAARDPSSSTPSKLVKLGRAGYHTRLVDLHRSNLFGPKVVNENDITVPEAWLSKDVIDSPLMYTKSRDIHCLGVVLLQMLIGKDVMEQFPGGVQSALRASSISPALQQHATNMLAPTKKAHASCLVLLADLSEMSLRNGIPPQGTTRAQSIAMPGPRTPRRSAPFTNNYLARQFSVLCCNCGPLSMSTAVLWPMNPQSLTLVYQIV